MPKSEHPPSVSPFGTRMAHEANRRDRPRPENLATRLFWAKHITNPQILRLYQDILQPQRFVLEKLHSIS